jgi:hypothetical protein
MGPKAPKESLFTPPYMRPAYNKNAVAEAPILDGGKI